MAIKEEAEVLQIGVDIRNALAEMTKFQRETMKQMETIARASDKTGDKIQKTNKKISESNDEWKSGLEDITKAYKQESDEIDNLTKVLEGLEKQSEKAHEKDREGLEENIRLLQKERKARISSLKEKGGGYRKYREQANEVKDTFKEAFSNLKERDFRGLTKSLPKALIKTFKAMPSFGVRLKELGAGMAGKGTEKGGAMGAGMKGMGSAMKGMGSLMGSLKPVIEAFSKIGPILGMVGGALVSLVKLFLDLDAKAKEFNKDILQSASTAEFLADAGGDATEAFDRVDTVLKGMRDTAFSFDNIDWGIKPEEHKAIINVLNQEGVSLASIGKQAGNTSEEVQKFTTELAHVSVAYSRAFGVPLQEINQLQAEMTQEMGIGLSQTAVAFEQIKKSAAEAGVGANKFFAIVRAASQDLSLWNNRMADATVLLGKLMKNMSPRTAQSFFQTLQKGFKGMSRTDLLQNVLLGGMDKVADSAKKEVDRNIQGMADSVGGALGMSQEDIAKLATDIKKNGRAAVEPLMKKLPDEMRGSLNESLTKMELIQSRMKKGAYGLGEAMSDFSPAAVAEVRRNQMLKFSGKKNLREAAGTIGAGAMAEKAGISVDEYNHYSQMESMMEEQSNLLKDKLMDPNTQKKMNKAGIKATKDGIEKASWAQLLDTMTDDQKDLINGVSEQEKMAKKQAKAQTSFYEQFDMLVQFIMNQIYDAMMGIWDTISEIPGLGKSRQQKDLEKTVRSSNDVGMLNRLRAAGGDTHKFAASTIMEGGLGKSLAQALDKYGHAKTDDEKVTAGYDLSKFTDSINRQFKDTSKIHDLFNSMGMKGAEASKVIQSMSGGKSFGGALSDSGLSSEQQVEALKKSLWFMDPDELAKLSMKTGAPAAGSPSADVVAAPVKAPEQPSTAKTPAATPPIAKSTADGVDVAKDNLSYSKDAASTLTSIDNQMDKFKMDTGFLNGPYAKATENSVLAAVRTALFEYYMYKDLDQGSVADMMAKGGMTGRAFSQSVGQGAQSGMSGDSILTSLKAPANATGGMVTGVNNGLAMVTAAAGEGLASVGPGERILPRGGKGSGGDNYYITVQGVGGKELASLIQASTMDTVYEYNRKQRFQ